MEIVCHFSKGSFDLERLLKSMRAVIDGRTLGELMKVADQEMEVIKVSAQELGLPVTFRNGDVTEKARAKGLRLDCESPLQLDMFFCRDGSSNERRPIRCMTDAERKIFTIHSEDSIEAFEGGNDLFILRAAPAKDSRVTKAFSEFLPKGDGRKGWNEFVCCFGVSAVAEAISSELERMLEQHPAQVDRKLLERIRNVLVDDEGELAFPRATVIGKYGNLCELWNTVSRKLFRYGSHTNSSLADQLAKLG